VLAGIAAKYRTLPAPRQTRKALPAPPARPGETGVYSQTGLRVA
jgi:hypothetical protein